MEDENNGRGIGSTRGYGMLKAALRKKGFFWCC